MLTLFTIPKAFLGHYNITQRNAIRSWLQLKPKPEIILFGDDKGVEKTAKEFAVLHIAQIEKNEFGTPLVNSAFNIARKSAKNNILVEISSDIILMSDFIPAVKQVANHPLFLMGGRRWDLDVDEEIDFTDFDWEEKLRQRINKSGKRHGFSGMDYFVFPCNLPHNLPPFAIGRPGWDNWLIYHIRSLKIPAIDATEVVTAIHQNHESSHLQVKKDPSKKIEAQRNLKLIGGFSNLMSFRDANWLLTSNGLEKPKFPRRIFSELSLFYPWRLLLSIKRKLKNFL